MKNRHRYFYTQDEIDFLKEIIKGRTFPDIRDLYKEKFNKDMSINELFAFRKKYKVKSGVAHKKKYNKPKYIYSQEEIEFLKSIIPNNYSTKIIKQYKEKFNKDMSINEYCAFKQRYKIKNGISIGIGINPNPKPSLPIGHEFISYNNGRIRTHIKIDEYKYMEKSRYIYEQHYGKIPENSVIIFLDGNRNNFNIDNLKCITKQEHRIMAGNKLYFKNKELNETSILVAKLLEKAKEVE